MFTFQGSLLLIFHRDLAHWKQDAATRQWRGAGKGLRDHRQALEDSGETAFRLFCTSHTGSVKLVPVTAWKVDIVFNKLIDPEQLSQQEAESVNWFL